MLPSLSRIKNHAHLRRHLWAATATLAGWYGYHMTTTIDNDVDNDVQVLQKYKEKKGWLPVASTTTNNITQCQGAFLRNLPRLRRLPTVEQLHETAQTDHSLESTYNVQWKQPLGEGAVGTVYVATHKQSHETVAIKKIPKHKTTSTGFQREMDALLKIRQHGNHPYICSMREHFEDAEHFYIVLDLIGGRELFDTLVVHGAFSEHDAARYIEQVASALHFLHGLGIVHADIKPENIMTTSKNMDDAVVKLVDLGCAHMLNHAPWMDHQTKHTANTPAYCPPEILREQRQKRVHPTMHPSFDMWSLGVVIYIMLVGAHPFDLDCDATTEEIEERILRGDKLPLRNHEYTEHLSEGAIELIEGLMQYDPKKRLTAQQILEHPWVQGRTATNKKIADSDTRLSGVRKYTTEIGSTFFKTLLSNTDSIRQQTSERMSVLESAFRRLDTEHQGSVRIGDSKESLSFSDVSTILSENMKNKHFPKGHVMYHQGSRGDKMYLIDSGIVEETCKDGFRKTRKNGEIVGLGSMLSKGKHSKTVRCLTPVHALEISRDVFEKYLTDQETFLSLQETDRHRRRERANGILRLSKASEPTQLAYGQILFTEGQEGTNLYMVEDGEVDISVQTFKVRTLQSGEVAGEHAAYHSKPYNVTAVCKSPSCSLQAIPSASLQKILKSDKGLKLGFRDLLLRRDFKKAVCVAIKKPFPTTEKEIRSAFEVLDLDSSNAISLTELRILVKNFDETYADQDIDDMLSSLDLNQSGSLTWEEFHRIFSMDKEA